MKLRGLCKRRLIVLTGLLLLVVGAAVFSTPPVYYGILGRWRGEAVYAGYPTSYWSYRIRRAHWTPPRGPFGILDRPIRVVFGDPNEPPAVLMGDRRAIP